ncbi:MAG: transketolase [Nitrospiraceae bacterium]|nr:MAG: transketolase [Nitrospiraceae bacterium]
MGSIEMTEINELQKIANKIRATCVQMAFDASHGHLKSALSCVEILVALYWRWLKVSPSNPADPHRDRFYMSKGHGVTSLYAVLAEKGIIDRKELAMYAKSGSCLPDHPCKHMLPVLEASSGSLGHCLGIATGALYALRLKGNPARAVVLMSDGECNEGSVWEAAMFARAQKLENLLAIVDYNDMQAVGFSDEIMGHTLLEEKFRSFGWAAKRINGNSISELADCLESFPFEKDKPSVIVAKTKVGVSFMEKNILWHYRTPSGEELMAAIDELGELPIQTG